MANFNMEELEAMAHQMRAERARLNNVPMGQVEPSAKKADVLGERVSRLNEVAEQLAMVLGLPADVLAKIDAEFRENVGPGVTTPQQHITETPPLMRLHDEIARLRRIEQLVLACMIEAQNIVMGI